MKIGSGKTLAMMVPAQRPYAALLALIGAAYAYRIGFDITGWWPGTVPMMWGASAFLLGPLLLLGWTYLPALGLGAWAIRLCFGESWDMALVGSIGDLVGAGVVVLILRTFLAVDLRFRRQADLWRLVLVSCLLGPLLLFIAALLGRHDGRCHRDRAYPAGGRHHAGGQCGGASCCRSLHAGLGHAIAGPPPPYRRTALDRWSCPAVPVAQLLAARRDHRHPRFLEHPGFAARFLCAAPVTAAAVPALAALGFALIMAVGASHGATLFHDVASERRTCRRWLLFVLVCELGLIAVAVARAEA